MAPDAAQVAGTAVVRCGPGPLGSALDAELRSVLGADLLDDGSADGPLRWFVAVVDLSAAIDRALEDELIAAAQAVASAGGGRIVVVVLLGAPASSTEVAARRGADEAGITGLARALARQVADRGVTVNVVRVGLLATGDDATDAVLAPLVRATPVRRAVTVDEVAAAVGHLVAPDAGYVNGIVLPVDGGAGLATGR